ncbi:MAG: hypothetical protein GY793_09175 [Proteobacteria bacterium]|nr:hypothetical protein [Pseudomonadota bacterium]
MNANMSKENYNQAVLDMKDFLETSDPVEQAPFHEFLAAWEESNDGQFTLED